ncbi:MAG TPA: hypothetical protein VNZ94_00685 [Xanthobacteraceae bacterium]|nr:hypothetical protein [Xanthobacteraceae bacterium]
MRFSLDKIGGELFEVIFCALQSGVTLRRRHLVLEGSCGWEESFCAPASVRRGRKKESPAGALRDFCFHRGVEKLS